METITRGESIPMPLDSSGAEHHIPRVRSYTALMIAPFLAFPMAVGASAGSGGAITDESVVHKNQWVYDASITSEQDVVLSVESNSEKLESIRNKLGLNMTDLSSILGVSRPTIYAWLQGQDPRPEYINRISELRDVAEKVSGYDLQNIKKLVRRPLQDGDTLIGLLKSFKPIDSALNELQYISERERYQRNKSRGLRLSMQDYEDTVNEHSIAADQ